MFWSELLKGTLSILLLANGTSFLLVLLWRCGLVTFIRRRCPSDRSETALLASHFRKIRNKFSPGLDRNSIQKWTSHHWGFYGAQLLSITTVLCSPGELGFNAASAVTVFLIVSTFAFAGLEAYFIAFGYEAERLLSTHCVESLSELEAKLNLQVA